MWFMPALEWLGTGALKAAPWLTTFFLGKEAVDNLTTTDTSGWTGGAGNMANAPAGTSTTSLWSKIVTGITVVGTFILIFVIIYVFRLLFPNFSIKKMFKK